MATFTQKTKQHLEICRNIETLLALDQQLTLYMYCTRVCRTYCEEIKYHAMFILTLSLILRFQDGQTKCVKY